MGLDEKLRHCLRPEDLPDSVLSDMSGAANEHLGTTARSWPQLIEQLGERRFGKRPRVGDPFAGGGSIPFEAARIGCDVYASDLNPVACLLTWGALNIVGGTEETRAKIASAQHDIVKSVDAEIVHLGIEHDGGDADIRLPADAPTRWHHGYRVSRGQIVAPETPPYSIVCPKSGWTVPLIETRRVHEPSKTILDLIPCYESKTYRIEARSGVDDEFWLSARNGTIHREYTEGSEKYGFFLVHDTGDGEFKVRIANRAKAFLYCVEVKDPTTGWHVPLARAG